MSENMAEDSPQGVEDQEKPTSVIVENQHDWFLQDFLERFISRGVEVGITLTVGGVIVTGVAISGGTYFEKLSRTIKGASGSGDLAGVISEEVQRYTEIYERPEGAPEGWVPGPIGYVHLKDAKIIAPGQRPLTERGTLWRAKLSSVDSFFIGTIDS